MLEVIVEVSRVRHPLYGIITRSHSEGSPRPRRRFYCPHHLMEKFRLPTVYGTFSGRSFTPNKTKEDTFDNVLKRLVDTRSADGYLSQVSAVPVHACCKCKHPRKLNNTGDDYSEDWQSKPIHKR